MEDSDVTAKPVCLLIQITMWDLANGKLLRTITDAHPPGTAILHVKVQSYTHTNTRVCVCVSVRYSASDVSSLLDFLP